MSVTGPEPQDNSPKTDSRECDPLSESDKQELIEEMKRALGGRLEGCITGVAAVLFGIALIRTGYVPMIPDHISTGQLIGVGTAFALLSLLLHIYLTRPHKKRAMDLIDGIMDGEE